MADIIVTDDSRFLRHRTCNILKAAGHNMREASDGIECMQLLEQRNPDVIFLDLVMPNMDGIAVLKTLQTQACPVPVIVLTADIQDTVRNECLALGAAAFMNKPPREAEVLNTLNEVLNNRADD